MTVKISIEDKMLRHVLIVVIASWAFVGPASGQEPNSPNLVLNGGAEAPDRICISTRRTTHTFTIGQGRSKIEVSLGGGACEPPGSGISDLWARFPTDDSKLDVVDEETCP